DSHDQPCLVFSRVRSDGDHIFWGCRGASGFAFEELPNTLELSSTTANYHLVLDSADRPHFLFSEHGIHGPDPNHRVHHAWYDGDWHRELIPLPPEYQQMDTNTEFDACMDIDAANRLRFVYLVAQDWQDDPQTPYQAGIAYAVKATTGANPWSASLL